ncbi:putative ribonuclease H-like domain-containing protein [Tanacetum coccineum]
MLLRPQHAGFGKPKTAGNPQQKEYKEKAVIDSGCSRHMTGNKCYLDEYKDYDGGFVSFGDGKGRISGKGKIKTGSLDFDDVYFCKELKYNLFSVSQICDKKNNVLFTDTECLVLSSDFKLLDESQVLLRVPRKDNIYSVDLKSVVVESFVNLSDKSGSDKGYHSVPPPLTGNFIPRKSDLTFIDEIVESENMDVTIVVTPSNDKTVENKGVSNTVETNAFKMNNTSAPIIKDWNYDDESEIDYTVRPSTEKIKSIKTVREIDAPKQNKHHPRGNQRNWNNFMSQGLGSDFKMINKACYVCSSFEHLHYVCDKKVVRPVWNNTRRVNRKNFSTKMTHPHPNRRFVPQAVLTRTGKINTAGASINTVNRPINTAASTPIGNPQQKEYKEKGVIDSDCSRHMTGNKCYLTEYEIARIEAIRLFLAYASFKGFVVLTIMLSRSAFSIWKVEEEAPRAWYETLSTYLLDNGFHRGQIDKTLFIKRHKDDILLVQVYVDDIIFGSTKKELSTEFEKLMHDKFQMSSMGELTFFLGLQVQQKSDEIFISQDKYVAEILKKFDFATVKIASTPIETNKALVKDEEAEAIDVHLYRSMIGSLMYLTASRPDIMFVLCTSARFQVTPKTSHLHVMKRIFRYLKAQSTNWVFVLWIQNQMLDYGFNFMNTKIYIDNESTICIVKNPVFHSKTKHIEIRHHFHQDSYEKRLIQVIKTHTDYNVVDLLIKAFNVSRLSTLRIWYWFEGGNVVICSQVGDDAIHKELSDRMERAATTASSLEAE